MSQSEEPPGLGVEATSRHGFELALRGYDKRQVDQYLSQVDGEMAAVAAKRDRALGEVTNLRGQLQQLQAELTELRARPPQIDRASVRDLGPMVEQMLALADKQARAIVDTATQRAANREAEAHKILSDAQEQAAQTLRGLDAQLSARRIAADKAHEGRLAAAEAELAQVRERADQARAEYESTREHAEQEAQRIAEQNAQQVERARAEAEALAEAARNQAEQELAQRRADLEREIGERRAEAAQKVAALHAQAQQQADEVRHVVNEQAAAHQQKLTVLQQEIQAQRESLAEVQSEMEAADRRLAQSSQKHSAVEHEIGQLQQRLTEVRQALAVERNRLEEARQAGNAAEQHAKEVRARVQREAKRVAEMAAAAVMAAAAGASETGEFPRVVLASRADGTADRTAERTADDADHPHAATLAANPGPPTNDGGQPRSAAENGAPSPRAPQPARLPDDGPRRVR